MRRLWFIIFSFVVLASCTNQTKETAAKDIKNDSLKTERKDYSFVDFFKEFSEDSVFQKEHIKFPLENTYIFDVEDECDSTLYWQKSEWQYINMKDTVIDGIEYVHEIDTTNNTITIHGIDTGILIEYYFSKSGNQWMLTKIEDHSN